MTVLDQAALPQPGTTAAPAPASRAPVTGQLPQVDLVRVLTFAAVIVVHASAYAFVATSAGNGASLMALHFTREVFFVITGFVLVHSYGRRPFRAGRFYRRRFALVGVPYLLWSLVYFVVNVPFAPDRGLWWRTLGYDLLTGTASYQLYFLLVSLQAYLALPALLALLRRTVGRHGRLLAASVVVQLALVELVHRYVAHVHGGVQVLLLHADIYLPTYELYFVAGALAAWHLPRLQHLVERHGRWVLAILLVSAGVAEGAYWAQVPLVGVVEAQDVLQPAMVPWSLAVALALYWLGSRWAGGGRQGRLGAMVRTGSRVSFGVYLVHPLVLDLLLDHGFAAGRGQVLPPALATVVLVVVAVAVSTVVVALVQRTRLSAPFSGRERVAPPDRRWDVAALVVAGGLLVGSYVTQQAVVPSLHAIAHQQPRP